jgi:hypothetical protein
MADEMDDHQLVESFAIAGPPIIEFDEDFKDVEDTPPNRIVLVYSGGGDDLLETTRLRSGGYTFTSYSPSILLTADDSFVGGVDKVSEAKRITVIQETRDVLHVLPDKRKDEDRVEKACLIGYEKKEINTSIVVFYVFQCESLDGFQWTIAKRFSSFVKLLKCLRGDASISKATRIPKLKKTIEDDVFSTFSKKYREDEHFIRRRSDEIALFIHSLTSDSIIWKSAHVQKFFDPHQEVSMISFQKFLESSEVGDIILFRTPGIVSSSYRAIIDGDWDHIGIMCANLKCMIAHIFFVRVNPPFIGQGGKIDGNSLQILESTKEGVNMYNLKNRLRSWNQYYPGIRIGYRKLVCARNPEFLDAVQVFVNKVKGSRYGFSISNFRLKTSRDDEENPEKAEYFCSELVAKLYKHAKILVSEKASCTYLPRKFLLLALMTFLNFILDHFSLTAEEIGMIEGTDFEDIYIVEMSPSLQKFSKLA